MTCTNKKYIFLLTTTLTISESESQPELVFAKMPTEQELSTRGAITENIPLRIFITDSIRIEIMPDCPPELLHVFVRSLKEHA